jgi:hypothetical protein
MKTVLNVRTNKKWRSANKFQESQSAMVSKLFDCGVPSPCLEEEETEPAKHSDHLVMKAVACFNSSPCERSLESARFNDACHQAMDTEAPPPMRGDDRSCACSEDTHCQPINSIQKHNDHTVALRATEAFKLPLL